MTPLPGRFSGSPTEPNRQTSRPPWVKFMISKKEEKRFEITRIRDFEPTARTTASCFLSRYYSDEGRIESVRTVQRAKRSPQRLSSEPHRMVPLAWYAPGASSRCWRSSPACATHPSRSFGPCGAIIWPRIIAARVPPVPPGEPVSEARSHGFSRRNRWHPESPENPHEQTRDCAKTMRISRLRSHHRSRGNILLSNNLRRIGAKRVGSNE